MTEKIIPQEQLEKSEHRENITLTLTLTLTLTHHDLEINHAKTTKHSFHNLKY